MLSNSPKRMLYMHIRDLEKNPHICFELEDYYPNPKRQAYTESNFESLDKDTVLEDVDGLDRLGFYFLVRLLSEGRIKDRQGRQWAFAAYTDQERLSVDIDEEPYRLNLHRSVCAFLPLNTLDLRLNAHSDVMCMRTGRMIVQNLL